MATNPVLRSTYTRCYQLPGTHRLYTYTYLTQSSQFTPNHSLRPSNYRVAVPRQGLVDGVVHHLEHQVVQPLRSRRADIHAGPLAHGLQPFKHGDLVGSVVAVHADGRLRRRGSLGSARRLRDSRRRGSGALVLIPGGMGGGIKHVSIIAEDVKTRI